VARRGLELRLTVSAEEISLNHGTRPGILQQAITPFVLRTIAKYVGGKSRAVLTLSGNGAEGSALDWRDEPL
jgi:hypothetical protein